MKYQIGDKIIVLHSDEEGQVIDIINDNMVMIEVRGVRFPAYMDQIDFPYFKMFTQKKNIPKKKVFVDNVKKEKNFKKVKTGDGALLSFIPIFDKDVFDDDVVERLKVYLINQDEAAYHFDYNIAYGGGESSFNLQGNIDALSEFYLHDVDFDDISDNPKFSFVFSLAKPDKKKAEYFEASLKTNGKKLFKRIEELQKKNEASFSYELFAKYPDRAEIEKLDLSKLGNAGFKVYDAGQYKQHIPPARSVVDIHIEKLMDNWQRLSSQQILDIQLAEFEKYYDLAVLHHLPSLIVIHGVGEGKLRDELHQSLKTKKEVKSFVNQYHHLYGYGATEIFLKK